MAQQVRAAGAKEALPADSNQVVGVLLPHKRSHLSHPALHGGADVVMVGQAAVGGSDSLFMQRAKNHGVAGRVTVSSTHAPASLPPLYASLGVLPPKTPTHPHLHACRSPWVPRCMRNLPAQYGRVPAVLDSSPDISPAQQSSYVVQEDRLDCVVGVEGLHWQFGVDLRTRGCASALCVGSGRWGGTTRGAGEGAAYWGLGTTSCCSVGCAVVEPHRWAAEHQHQHALCSTLRRAHSDAHACMCTGARSRSS